MATGRRKAAGDSELRVRVGHAIKAARAARGMTQAELASQLSVTQGQVAKYEGGGDLPSLEILIVMAGKLGVSLDVLVGRAQPVEAPTVVVRFGRSARDEVDHDKDLIKIPLIELERAASWRARPLGTGDVLGYVYAPLFHFKERANHRLACVPSPSAILPIVMGDAVLCIDYTDIPAHSANTYDRGLFLVKDTAGIRICKVHLSGNNIILSDNSGSIRPVDLRRHSNPLIARVVWLCQTVQSATSHDSLHLPI